MRTLYINAFSGMAGDMFVGALLDAGANCPEFWEQLAQLPMDNHACTVACEPVLRNGLSATLFTVKFDGHDHDHTHVTSTEHAPHGRSLSDVLAILHTANLPAPIHKRAQTVFQALANAEATVHGCPVDRVHFHEVGAFDAIVDITAACIALELLNVTHINCGPIAVGSGVVHCAHGDIPVPVPAVAALLADAPLVVGSATGELTTPTGAALLRTVVDEWVEPINGTLVASGYGAGARDPKNRANVVQALLFEPLCTGNDEVISQIECTLDDMPGERLSHLIPLLFARGALDVAVVACLMKKSRQGMIVQVLCTTEKREQIAELLLRETSTFGVRWHNVMRRTLRREERRIDTRFGEIIVKVGYLPVSNECVRISPEYESCSAAARKADVPLADVYDAAIAALANNEER